MFTVKVGNNVQYNFINAGLLSLNQCISTLNHNLLILPHVQFTGSLTYNSKVVCAN